MIAVFLPPHHEYDYMVINLRRCHTYAPKILNIYHKIKRCYGDYSPCMYIDTISSVNLIPQLSWCYGPVNQPLCQGSL